MQYNESLYQNLDNIQHHYGNYNGSLRTVQQTRTIKHRNNKSKFNDPSIKFNHKTRNIIHPSIQEVMLLQRRWRDDDLKSLGPKAAYVDETDCGWIHSMVADIPSFAIYHHSVYEYPFHTHFKWLGSYSAKIFGRFGENVRHNSRSEKSNAFRRFEVERKNTTQSMSAYVDTVKQTMEKRLAILVSANTTQLMSTHV